jgi:hypothetical protein
MTRKHRRPAATLQFLLEPQSLPLATLLHLDIQPNVGDHLIDAGKATDLSQFVAQDRHGLGAKLGHASKPLGPFIRFQEFLYLCFQLKQIHTGVFELVTQDLDAGRAGGSCQAAAAGLLGQSYQLLRRLGAVIAGCQFMQLGGYGLHCVCLG